jgi:NADH:ubiquinone oxidoreductase subunit E
MEPIRVRVCVGTNCCFAGGESIIEALEDDADLASFVRIEAMRCLDKTCAGGTESPIVAVGDRLITRATLEVVMEEIERQALPLIVGSPGEEGRDA